MPLARASLYIVYFGIGFTLAAAVSMTLLSLLRPMLGELSGAPLVMVVTTPLWLGVGFGARVMRLGHEGSLPLSQALKRAAWIGSRS